VVAVSSKEEKPKREVWREALIVDNRGLVCDAAKQFRGHPVSRLREDIEDLCGEGYKALIKAADTFDKSKGIEFSTYAVNCILNEMNMWIRANKKRYAHEKRLSYRDSTVVEHGATANNAVHMDEPPDETGIMLSNVVASALGKLDERDQTLLRLRFYDDKTYDEIGEAMGFSHQAAHQAVARAVARMRDVVDPDAYHERSTRAPNRTNKGVRKTDDLLSELIDKTGE